MVLGLKLWWAYTWRSVLVSILLGIVIVAVASLIVSFVYPHVDVTETNASFGGLLSFIAGIWVMKRLLTKGFGGYKLVVVEKEAAEKLEDEIDAQR